MPVRYLTILALALPWAGALAGAGHTSADPHPADRLHAEGDASFGGPGDPRRVSRTLVVTASDDMRYAPATIDVTEGETVRLVVKNTGRIPHELVLGPLEKLEAHAVQMRRHPGMEHDEPGQVMVGPGETAELVWRFSHAGATNFACTIPGHLEAGMKGAIRVHVLSPKAQPAAGLH